MAEGQQEYGEAGWRGRNEDPEGWGWGAPSALALGVCAPPAPCGPRKSGASSSNSSGGGGI